MYKDYWDNFNLVYLKENNNNFDIIKIKVKKDEIEIIILKAKKSIISLLKIYKDRINDYKKSFNKIFAGNFDKIGEWAPIPKVHKMDKNGKNIRKLRPIINLKNTIITISCQLFEISRKLIFR